MSCSFSTEQIEATRAFHGHSCPGLTIGIRAAELCLQRLGHDSNNRLVAVTETDMCGVDAIQFLTGCTYGKGNLIHRDYGKTAFSFFRRETGEGFRALFNPPTDEANERARDLMRRQREGMATETEQEECVRLRQERIERILAAELDELFDISTDAGAPPRPARILESLICTRCGESTMESRTRRYGGEFYCFPCFETVEQKR